MQEEYDKKLREMQAQSEKAQPKGSSRKNYDEVWTVKVSQVRMVIGRARHVALLFSRR